jgi:hypothetical protein
MRNVQGTAPTFQEIEHLQIVLEFHSIPLRKRFASPRAKEICRYLAANNEKHLLLETVEDYYIHLSGKPSHYMPKNMLFDVLMHHSLEEANQLIALCPELVADTVSSLLSLHSLVKLQERYKLYEDDESLMGKEISFRFNPKKVEAACRKLINAEIPAQIEVKNLNTHMKECVTNLAIKNINSIQDLETLFRTYYHYIKSPILNARRHPIWDNFCSLFNRNTKFREPSYPSSMKTVIFVLQRQAMDLMAKMENTKESIREMLESGLFSSYHFRMGVPTGGYNGMKAWLARLEKQDAKILRL